MQTPGNYSAPGYTLQHQLGAGNYGVVYLGYELSTARPVAVKFLTKLDERSFRSFRQEARHLARQANNPHVVDYLAFHPENKPPFVVMEFCEGGSLRTWVEIPHPWPEVTAALLHAALGLKPIHAIGGFHRDVKPDNLLMSSGEGRVLIKLGDLGLARAPTVDASEFTDGPSGTRAYMAPEVLATGKFSAASDVFALGITGIELLTGSRDPSKLESAQVPSSLKKLLLEMVDTVSSRRPSISTAAAHLRGLTPSKLAAAKTPTAPIPSSGKQGGSLWGPLLVGGLLLLLIAGSD